MSYSLIQELTYKTVNQRISAMLYSLYDVKQTLYVLFFSSCCFTGVLACSLTVLSVHGLYSASDDVIELNPSNFNREVLQSDSLWLIEFYAPW